jgi:hypothetical protein
MNSKYGYQTLAELKAARRDWTLRIIAVCGIAAMILMFMMEI